MRIKASIGLALFLLLAPGAWAAVTVHVQGPGGSVTRTLPDAGGSFDVDLPLNANSVNQITVSAVDAFTNRVEKRINVTQLSLDKIVVAQVTTERLPPERVVELVNEGVIDLVDPENYNVSTFNIVLTIGGQRVPISTPIVTPVQEPMGYETIRPKSDPGSGGSSTIRDSEIVVFELTPPGPPGIPPPRIYGVIVMEGRIKSLKEFFSVRLLLMNTSGIFTLKDVLAQLTFPDGGLSHTLPQDGFISFGDILPGDGGQPGQKEREFIIRGDEIGVRKVKIDFGGTVAGPGLPEEDPIAFNGTAESSVEVKGPPNFLVTVIHPPAVFTNAPYELVVEIQNTGELPALYASLELEVGADALIENCVVNTNTLDVECSFGNGPVIRPFGHIMPGEKVRETYRLQALKEGPITSCLGISDQNISLQVAVGNIGCLVGQYPPTVGVPEGLPVVNVVPSPNQLGVSPTAPVSAFFSELMSEVSIHAGDGGTFNVFDPEGNIVNGGIRFVTIGNRTVAIWQRDAGANILDDNTRYEVVLTSDIRDLDGNALFNPWRSWFRTTSLTDDQDPPELTMTILPPVDPNYVLPGQLVVVNAYASDQGTGIRRIELRIKSLDDTNAVYELIDQKTVFDPLVTLEPSIFTIDSAQLTPGHTYQLLGTAYDVAGNARDATLAFIMAVSADPPVIVLPPDPTNYVLRGVSVPITPTSVSGGVRQVQYYLNENTNAFATVFLAPWQTTLRTLDLAIGVYTVKAVAVDALLQTGEDEFVFELVENLNEPQVSFGSAVNGAQYVTGSVVSVLGFVEDPVGLRSVQFFLNDLSGPPIATDLNPFQLNTTGLSTGAYKIILLATNNLGIANNVADPQSYLEFNVVESPPGPPPPAPVVLNLTEPDDGTTTVTGTSVPGASVTIVNTNFGFVQSVVAATNGNFVGVIAASGGDGLSLTAFHAPTSPSNSAPTLVVVPTPLAVTNLIVAPANKTFTAAGQFQDFVVTAQLAGGGTSNVTARSSFSSSAPSVASVNQSGRMVAQNNGAATLTATFKTNSAQANVLVDIVTMTNFVVIPDSVVLVFTGQTAQLQVVGQFNNGTTSVLSGGLSFGNSDPAIIAVNNAGLVTAVADGNAQVYVSAGGGLPPKTIPVSVISGLNPAPLVSITSPADNSGYQPGQPVNVTVNALDPIGGVTKIFLNVTGAVTHADNRQISPPAGDATRAFSFTVPTNAPVGGAFTVFAQAQDVGGLTSTIKQITLHVVDTTPPVVNLLSPLPGDAFNSGHTVTVTIAASDNVGVTEVGYVTAGALSQSDSKIISPAVLSTNATFQFIVPPSPPEPDLFIFGVARDAAGNAITSSPVLVELTGADITPPETYVTAVAPPNGATAVVSYTVLSGMDDLKHVQIYFRRNGRGTFNLYTETEPGTNVLGRYFPQSGTNGTVVFDSTRMGGDGFYEFYSVGVDIHDNRESAPTNGFDHSATFNAGTVWVGITNAIFLAATNTAFDNANIRVSNAVVTLEGNHTFLNVELLGTSRVTHAAATTNSEPVFNLTAWTIMVDSNAAIDVTGLGYLGGQRAGNPINNGRTTNNAVGSSVRSGGSHGGLGGVNGGTPNSLYGSVITPIDLGSGGSSRGDGFSPGGNGGGRIALNVINVVADGAIRANGAPGTGSNAGSGSGGSVYILTRSLSGLGLVEANGGANEVGGGGGRVAIHYLDISTKDPAEIRAIGGDGSTADGGNGTVFLFDFGASNSTLVVDGQGVASPFSNLPIPVGFTFNNIIIRNNARAIVDDPIVVSDSLQILTGSILTHTTGQTNGLRITAGDVFVDATSSIDVSGKGYRGGQRDGNGSNRGETLGGQLGAQVRSGGSYGGLGGIESGSGNNLVYGTPYDPIYLGSGGSSRSDSFAPGGNGGGRITIAATDRVRVLGSIRADGQNGSGFNSGSGSGGSIKITTSLFEGTGSMTANGGANEVGGGGGRVAVNYSFIGTGTNGFNGLRNVTAAGGKGTTRQGSAGTVLFKQNSQASGDLYVDATTTNAQASLWSPLTPVGFGKSVGLTTNELTVDGAVQLLPGGLAGLKLKPNVNGASEFTIVDNTATTITVDVSGGTNLGDVANVGDEYAAMYRFDNVILRRGAWLVTSDKIEVNQTVSVTENSVITHFDATTNYLPGLDITANMIVVASNSAINVDDRGYLGGQRTGNPINEGRTLGNAAGSSVRSGGSYGGLGGVNGGTPNLIYGDLKNPVELGSGGSSRFDSFSPGGDGGGRIKLTAANLTVDGVVSANGANGSGFNSGSGSGGSILLNVNAMNGSGTVQANGGAFEVAGGGGRVAVNYTTLGMDTAQFRALGGDGSTADGGHGTVFFKSVAQTNGHLIVDGFGFATVSDSTPIPTNVIFDHVTFQNGARIQLISPLVAFGSVRIIGNTVLTHPLSFEDGLRIEAASLLIASNSAIDVSARGYRGGQRDGNGLNQGLTTNSAVGSSVRSGGSYGGLGGVNGGTPNPTYGVATNPVYLGSGGSSRGDSFALGGNGGGRITLVITGVLTNNGAIRADGQNGSGSNSGGGSGGSVKIFAGTLTGLGTLEADGGGNEVGGGGGRVAVYYNALSYNTNSATANGGSGSTSAGSAGTVYFEEIVGVPTPFGLPGLTPAVFPPTILSARVNRQQIVLVSDVGGGGTYVLQFSPGLLPSSWTTLQYLVTPVWTGSLPMDTDRGFFRIIPEE